MSERRNISVGDMENYEREQNAKKHQQPAEKQESTFNEKNYFNDRVSATEPTKVKRLRLLDVDKNHPVAFLNIHMHSIELKPSQVRNGGSKWKKFICLEKTEGLDESLGHHCPFCEMNREAWAKEQEYKKLKEAEEKKPEGQKDASKVGEYDRMYDYWKTIRRKYQAKPASIARVIDRSDEDFGPKFWLTNTHDDGTDPMNRILQLWRSRYNESVAVYRDEYGLKETDPLPADFVPNNILDFDNGKDIEITINLVKGEGGKPDSRSYSVVDWGNPKPISRNPETYNKWLDDEKVWTDVFVPKPYEYLSIILDGGNPFYNKKEGKWVPWVDQKNGDAVTNVNSEQTAATQAANEKIRQAQAAAVQGTTVAPQPIETDEYPFD